MFEPQEACIGQFYLAVWIQCILFGGCSNFRQLCSCSHICGKVAGVSIFQEVVLVVLGALLSLFLKIFVNNGYCWLISEDKIIEDLPWSLVLIFSSRTLRVFLLVCEVDELVAKVEIRVLEDPTLNSWLKLRADRLEYSMGLLASLG